MQDLLVLLHVVLSQTRDRTHVPSIGRRILNHLSTREVLYPFLSVHIMALSTLIVLCTTVLI